MHPIPTCAIIVPFSGQGSFWQRRTQVSDSSGRRVRAEGVPSPKIPGPRSQASASRSTENFGSSLQLTKKGSRLRHSLPVAPIPCHASRSHGRQPTFRIAAECAKRRHGSGCPKFSCHAHCRNGSSARIITQGLSRFEEHYRRGNFLASPSSTHTSWKCRALTQVRGAVWGTWLGSE